MVTAFVRRKVLKAFTGKDPTVLYPVTFFVMLKQLIYIPRMRPSRRSISRTPQGRDSDMSATSSYSAYPASKAGRKRSSSSSSSSSEASYKFSRKKAGVQPPSGQDKQRDPQKATWDELGIDDISADEGSARSVSVTDDDLQFAKDMVKTHNKYRKLHGVPELKLSKKVDILPFLLALLSQ
jgi:uncharacterized protein YkwD